MIFISYSWTNVIVARRLEGSLRALGHKTWMDHRDLDLSRPLEAQITSAIRQSTSFLVVLSASARSSPWVRFENAEAARRNLLKVEIELEDFESQRWRHLRSSGRSSTRAASGLTPLVSATR